MSHAWHTERDFRSPSVPRSPRGLKLRLRTASVIDWEEEFRRPVREAASTALWHRIPCARPEGWWGQRQADTLTTLSALESLGRSGRGQERRLILGAPSRATIKRLFGVSGNQCAYPDCTERMIHQSGTPIGQVCHICGDKFGAKRYDPDQTDAERQDFSNLILLCPKHHIIIDDDEATYSVPVLREMKRRHEGRATETLIISDGAAERILLIMAGVGAGASMREIAQGIGHVAGTIANALGARNAEPKPESRDERIFSKAPKLLEILRYAPKGVVAYSSYGEEHLQLGKFIGEVFAKSGWRNMGSNSLPEHSREIERRAPAYLVIAFLLKDPHQIAIAKQAIDEVFTTCGFQPVNSANADEYLSGHHDCLRVLIIVGDQRVLWSTPR